MKDIIIYIINRMLLLMVYVFLVFFGVLISLFVTIEIQAISLFFDLKSLHYWSITVISIKVLISVFIIAWASKYLKHSSNIFLLGEFDALEPNALASYLQTICFGVAAGLIYFIPANF